MTLRVAWLTLSCFALSIAGANAQAAGEVFATVRITQPVLADGKPLPAGTYDVRLAAPGTSTAGMSDAQRVVEFVANGQVVATEIAEVLPNDEATPVGTSSQPSRAAARVEMLKGGEFLRVSVRRPDGRYLIHLPTAPS
jgi:hypothetical protein